MNILKGLPAMHREQVIEEVKVLLGITEDVSKEKIESIGEETKLNISIAPTNNLGKSKKTVLSFTEGCKFLGLSKSSCYKMTASGILPFSKPNGKTIYFDRNRLEDWMLGKEDNNKKEDNNNEEKLILQFFEKAKNDKDALFILKELSVRFEIFELAVILKDIQIEKFPSTSKK